MSYSNNFDQFAAQQPQGDLSNPGNPQQPDAGAGTTLDGSQFQGGNAGEQGAVPGGQEVKTTLW